MKKRLTLFFSLCILSGYPSLLPAQIPPLPPLNTAPLWEVNFHTQTGAVFVDTITYGRRYCLCGHDYVAIVRNGVEEIMYMRQDTDQAFYLLDTDDCASERLLYDYSSDTAHIPVENILSIPDSFDVFTFALSPLMEYGLFQLPVFMLDFTYQLGPFTLHSGGYWIRGVGDISHPFFPLFNNYNSSAQETTYYLKRLTVDHLVWYEAAAEPPSYSIIYVDQDAAGGLQNGSSWTDAYTRLDVALQHAQAGDLVWVAEGVYKPTTGTDRGAVFELRNGIQLYGGFSGTETNLLDRGDPALHPTVLSGDIGLPGDTTDNSYHLLRIQDVRDFAVVDGFTIRDGNALGGNIAFPYVENGAGILIYSALPTTDTADIVLKNNILTHHSAGSGAALSLHNGYATPARLRISQCTISDNFALNWGGGLFIPPALTQPLQISVSESSFQTNYAYNSDGGAIYDYHAQTRWEFVNTVFAENGVVVGDGGGAMGLYHIQGDKDIQILNCEFRDNFCPGNGAGLGYLHYGGPGRLQLSIQKTRFLRNTSFANGGGAVHIGTVVDGFVDFDCMECDFIENSSLNWGGAVSMQLHEVSAPCTIMFDRCEFTSNQSAGNVGGAIHLERR
ncbi:MAG: hypothetical protein KDC54_21655, partial [Lewinella sp.]|nr:hypothetical protein [Lewinella sp.]